MADRSPSGLTRIAQVMGMSDAVWRHHANPWSVWTRFSCLPLIALAVWSRAWLGWGALAPLTLALIWTWANPRVFPEPASLGTWASRAVLGERVHIYRRDEVQAHHHLPLRWLTWAPLVGMAPMIWGLWHLSFWPTVTGVFLTVAFKVWFCDRMVWIASEWEADGHGWDELDQDAPVG